MPDSRVTIDSVKKQQIDDSTTASARTASADAWMADQLAAGFVSSDGIALGLTNEDVLLLTGNFVLAKEAAAMNLPIPAVIDTDGVSHELEIDDLTTLMLEYGQHRASLSADYQTQLAGE
jgi:hypothetical protein